MKNFDNEIQNNFELQVGNFENSRETGLQSEKIHMISWEGEHKTL